MEVEKTSYADIVKRNGPSVLSDEYAKKYSQDSIVFKLHKIFEKYYELGLNVEKICKDDMPEFILCFDDTSLEALWNDDDFVDVSVDDNSFVLSKQVAKAPEGPQHGLVSMLIHSWFPDSYLFKFRKGPAKVTHREEPYRFFYEECDIVEIDGHPAESSHGMLRTVHDIVTNDKRRDMEKYWPQDIILLPDFKNAMKFFQDDNSYAPFKIHTPRNIYYYDTDPDNNQILVRLTDTRMKKIATCTWADMGPNFYVQKCPEMCEELISRGYVMSRYMGLRGRGRGRGLCEGSRAGLPTATTDENIETYDRKKCISSMDRDDPNLIELLEDEKYVDSCPEVGVMKVPEHAIIKYRNQGDYELVDSYLKLFSK